MDASSAQQHPALAFLGLRRPNMRIMANSLIRMSRFDWTKKTNPCSTFRSWSAGAVCVSLLEVFTASSCSSSSTMLCLDTTRLTAGSRATLWSASGVKQKQIEIFNKASGHYFMMLLSFVTNTDRVSNCGFKSGIFTILYIMEETFERWRWRCYFRVPLQILGGKTFGYWRVVFRSSCVLQGFLSTGWPHSGSL